jgi:DMSO/TMAO reductase YedYZ molybdopterin-dependent catalytic subunit
MKNLIAMKRRNLLKLTGIAAVAGLTGGCDAVGSLFGRMFAMPPRETNYFTENKKFYVVNYSDSPFNVSRDLRQDEWRLTVKGEVKKSLSLGWRDLLNRDNFEQVSTLMCIDTLPGGDSLGNARWRGISLKKLLQDAEVDEDTTRDIVFRGADAYDDSIPLSRAMQDDVMLAFLMNGEKLPKEHGFPLRLLVPGLYGIKNVKWIVEIEAYAGDYRDIGNAKGGPTTPRSRHFHGSIPPDTTRRYAAPNNDSAGSPSAGRTPSVGLKSAWIQAEPGILAKLKRRCRPTPGSFGTTPGARRNVANTKSRFAPSIVRGTLRLPNSFDHNRQDRADSTRLLRMWKACNQAGKIRIFTEPDAPTQTILSLTAQTITQDQGGWSSGPSQDARLFQTSTAGRRDHTRASASQTRLPEPAGCHDTGPQRSAPPS